MEVVFSTTYTMYMYMYLYMQRRYEITNIPCNFSAYHCGCVPHTCIVALLKLKLRDPEGILAQTL